jgi:cupin superfamily acireductone dioxygenase involved in methionine salvage
MISHARRLHVELKYHAVRIFVNAAGWLRKAKGSAILNVAKRQTDKPPITLTRH